jgi:hypothetical protein
MKIIFLNALGGKFRDEITEYITIASRSTDIFCFQETDRQVRLICKDALAGWREIAARKDMYSEDEFNLAIYVNKNISVLSSEVIFKSGEDVGLGMYSEVQAGDKIIHIGNFHGVSQPGDKLDNAERITQSKGLIDFFKDKQGLKIIGGDFNALPETKSIQMFEENGYKDLIKDFKIPTTRNRLVWELFPETKLYYSDYVFVSPDVKVKSFLVPNIEISDHLPMELEIEL